MKLIKSVTVTNFDSQKSMLEPKAEDDFTKLANLLKTEAGDVQIRGATIGIVNAESNGDGTFEVEIPVKTDLPANLPDATPAAPNTAVTKAELEAGFLAKAEEIAQSDAIGLAAGQVTAVTVTQASFDAEKSKLGHP